MTTEVAGKLLGVVLGIFAVAPVLLRLVRGPRGWETWAGGLATMSFSVAFLLFGLGADWFGCAVSPEAEGLVCRQGQQRCPVAECGLACRAPGATACDVVLPRDSWCAPGQEPAFEYCEMFTGGWIQQPVNNWSAWAFAGAGLWALFMLRVGRPGAAHEVMRRPTFYSVGYGLTLVFLWFGTMLMHASFKDWGGFLDTFSIVFWLLFSILFSLGRHLGWWRVAASTEALRFLGLLGVIAAVVGFMDWSLPSIRMWTSVTLGAIWLSMELGVIVYQAIRKQGPGQRRSFRRWPWYAALFTSFAGAFTAKALSDFTGVWCDPRSPWQGHAVWHVLAALTGFFGFLYLRDEEFSA